MKRLARWMLLVIWAVPMLSGCGLPGEAAPLDFGSLARWIPADVSQAFFLNFKPTGEAGRSWQRIRNLLQANPQAWESVDSLLQEFHVQDLGLGSFIVGPAVNGYMSTGTQYIVLQVNGESAARDALLLQNPGNLDWEREEYEGKALYHRRAGYLYGQPQWRAFAAYDGLIVVATSFIADPVDDLKRLASLPEAESLASLPSWKTLQDRLPADPMGLILLNAGDSIQPDPLTDGDPPPGTALAQQIEALALAAVPEADGMRVAIAGALSSQADVPGVIQQLLELPGVDPSSWAGLPANTAVAFSTHDASTVWPVLSDIFDLQGLDILGDAIGLDLGADLFGADGPFSGDLAMAITPPLLGQPISQGLSAGQLVFLARGSSQAQIEDVQAAMESRGAVFGAQTVEGVELQVQAGTELAGYAISMGFDDDLLLLGTSPVVVDQSVVARRNGNGLVADPVFQAVLSKMPQSPTFFAYLNTASLVDLEQANMTAQQYGQSALTTILGGIDAIGLGLSFSADRIDGAVHFYMREE